MPSHRSLDAIRLELVRRGLPVRYVNRILRELDDHLSDIASEKRQTGLDDCDATTIAAQIMGIDRHKEFVDVIETQYRHGEFDMSHRTLFLGVSMTVVGILGYMLIGPRSGVGPFLDFPSLAPLLAIVTGGLLISFPGIDVYTAFRHSLLGMPDSDAENSQQYVAVFARASRLTWAAGTTCTIASAIRALGHNGNDGLLLVELAIALLPLLYAVVLAELVLKPLEQRLLVNCNLARGVAPE